MKQLTINDFITAKEASRLYGKHELTIARIVKKHFKEGSDYRKLDEREQLLIQKSCLDKYFNNVEAFKEERNTYERKVLSDRYYRI